MLGADLGEYDVVVIVPLAVSVDVQGNGIRCPCVFLNQFLPA